MTLDKHFSHNPLKSLKIMVQNGGGGLFSGSTDGDVRDTVIVSFYVVFECTLR